MTRFEKQDTQPKLKDNPVIRKATKRIAQKIINNPKTVADMLLKFGMPKHDWETLLFMQSMKGGPDWEEKEAYIKLMMMFQEALKDETP